MTHGYRTPLLHNCAATMDMSWPEATMCGLSARREYRYGIYELSFRVSLLGILRLADYGLAEEPCAYTTGIRHFLSRLGILYSTALEEVSFFSRFKITIRRYRKLLKYVMGYPSINFHVRITPRTRAHVRPLNATRDLQRRYITWLWKLTLMGYRDYSPPVPER